MRYYFMNSAATTGDIPLWMPYMTHGTLANWWYFIQGGLLQNIALALGPLLKSIDFLLLYHIQIWVEYFVLLTGVWLLSQRFYQTLTSRLFVTVAIISTTIWTNQIWFNMRLVYALPFVLYLIETYIDSGKIRYLFAATALFSLQWVGNLPYVIPLQALLIASYLLLQFTLTPYRLVAVGCHLRRTPLRTILVLLVGAIPLVCSVFILSSGTEWIVTYNPGRNQDGTTSFEAFRTYGNHLSIEDWFFLLLPSSLLNGANLFLGYLTASFALFALIVVRNRAVILLAALAVFFALFASGQPAIMMRGLYDWFPGMHYYRHIGFAAIYVKFALCMLSGIGVDHALLHPPCSGKTYWALVFVTILLGIWAAWFALFWAAISAAALLITAMCLRKNFHRRIVIVVVMAAHVPALVGYRFEQVLTETIPIERRAGPRLTQFAPMPFVRGRCQNLFNPADMNVRSSQFLPFIDYARGTLYWSTESFLFQDCLESPFRTDHLLIPLDQYMRTYWGQPFDDRTRPLAGRQKVRLPTPAYWESRSSREWDKRDAEQAYRELSSPALYDTLRFPTAHPASARIAGARLGKLQIFANGQMVESLAQAALIMRAPSYQGNFLLLFDPELSRGHEASLKNDFRHAPTGLADQPRSTGIDVQSFTPNRISIHIETPRDQPPQWLLFSDVWHPFWKAKNNGSPIKIYRANLAYKAVRLPPGFNTVEFSFESRGVEAAYYVLAGYSFVFCIFIGWLIWRDAIICPVKRTGRGTML